jgi:acyl carrier protein
MTRQETYNEIIGYLTGTFEVPEQDIAPGAHLIDDLNLDSIDLVDLMVKLQECIGTKVSPEQFIHVRTVQDLADLVHELYAVRHEA